jgi:hypothetical protein
VRLVGVQRITEFFIRGMNRDEQRAKMVFDALEWCYYAFAGARTSSGQYDFVSLESPE